MAKKKATRQTKSALHRHIRKILVDTSKAWKGEENTPYLTAYQILALLPPGVRARLIRQHGAGGKGSRDPNSAPKRVALTCEAVTSDVVYFRTDSVKITIDSTDVEPGGKSCGLYRLREPRKRQVPRRKKSSVGTP
jgi:hypothetical protein